LEEEQKILNSKTDIIRAVYLKKSY